MSEILDKGNVPRNPFIDPQFQEITEQKGGTAHALFHALKFERSKRKRKGYPRYRGVSMEPESGGD
jgi:hypothetical protein